MDRTLFFQNIVSHRSIAIKIDHGIKSQKVMYFKNALSVLMLIPSNALLKKLKLFKCSHFVKNSDTEEPYQS